MFREFREPAFVGSVVWALRMLWECILGSVREVVLLWAGGLGFRDFSSVIVVTVVSFDVWDLDVFFSCLRDRGEPAKGSSHLREGECKEGLV